MRHVYIMARGGGGNWPIRIYSVFDTPVITAYRNRRTVSNLHISRPGHTQSVRFGAVHNAFLFQRTFRLFFFSPLRFSVPYTWCVSITRRYTVGAPRYIYIYICYTVFPLTRRGHCCVRRGATIARGDCGGGGGEWRIRSRRIAALLGPCAIRPIRTAAQSVRARTAVPRRPSGIPLACKNLVFVLPVPTTTTRVAYANRPERRRSLRRRLAYRQRDVPGPGKSRHYRFTHAPCTVLRGRQGFFFFPRTAGIFSKTLQSARAKRCADRR